MRGVSNMRIMVIFSCLFLAVVVVGGGCESKKPSQDVVPGYQYSSHEPLKEQKIGDLTLFYIGELDDGSDYRRFVWEVRTADGTLINTIIRGYGSLDNGTEGRRVKHRVQVEK